VPPSQALTRLAERRAAAERAAALQREEELYEFSLKDIPVRRGPKKAKGAQRPPLVV
jgi:hypothetical protein